MVDELDEMRWLLGRDRLRWSEIGDECGYDVRFELRLAAVEDGYKI